MSIILVIYWAISTWLCLLFTLNNRRFSNFCYKLPILYNLLAIILSGLGVILFSWIVLPIIGIWALIKTFPEAKSVIIESLKECLKDKEN